MAYTEIDSYMSVISIVKLSINSVVSCVIHCDRASFVMFVIYGLPLESYLAWSMFLNYCQTLLDIKLHYIKILLMGSFKIHMNDASVLCLYYLYYFDLIKVTYLNNFCLLFFFQWPFHACLFYPIIIALGSLDPVRLSSFVTNFGLSNHIVISKSLNEVPDLLFGEFFILVQILIHLEIIVYIDIDNL